MQGFLKKHLHSLNSGIAVTSIKNHKLIQNDTLIRSIVFLYLAVDLLSVDNVWKMPTMRCFNVLAKLK